MDSEKFDELIKHMGTARVTRLTALRGLAGGALAAVAGVAIATSEAEAGKKRAKKRGKKKTRRSATYTAPTYDNGPALAPKPIEKPKEEPTKCEAEYCDYGQHWDTKDCRCKCNDTDYEVCNATDEYSYLRGTCVYAKCGEYRKYNSDTCDCEEVCYPPIEGCGPGYHWNYDDCKCEPDGGGPGTCPGTPGPRRNGSDCQTFIGSGVGNSNLCESCCCVNRGASQRCASPDPSNPVCAPALPAS